MIVELYHALDRRNTALVNHIVCFMGHSVKEANITTEKAVACLILPSLTLILTIQFEMNDQEKCLKISEF